MSEILNFEDWRLNENTGADTSWTRERNGKEITITMKDIIKYLDENEVEVEHVTTELIKPLIIDTDRDPKRVEAADLEYPIIVSKKDDQYRSILDGQHRVVKAINNEIGEMKVRVLNLDSAPEEYQRMFR